LREDTVHHHEDDATLHERNDARLNEELTANNREATSDSPKKWEYPWRMYERESGILQKQSDVRCTTDNSCNYGEYDECDVPFPGFPLY
jgi:hypothetical protein